MPTLAERNNNPGNLRDSKFTQSQPGYVGSNKGFGVFDNVLNGFKAQVKLLENYYDKGRTTIGSIISRYAPSSENDTNSYANSVSKALGIGVNETLGKEQLPYLAQQMSRIEGFKGFGDLISGTVKSVTAPAAGSGSIVEQAVTAITPTWISDLLNGRTAGRWISVIIGIILIALAVAAFTLTSDTGKQVIAAIK